jgi:hypothetical protein
MATGAYMPALELLGMLAYGRPDGFVQPTGATFYARWRMIPDGTEPADTNPLVVLLRRSVCDTGEPLDAKRKLDDLLEREGKPVADVLAALLADIAAFNSRSEHLAADFERAARRVCEAISLGKLHAWGRNAQSATPEAIPSEDAHPDWTTLLRAQVSNDCDLTLRPDADIEEQQRPFGPAVGMTRSQRKSWPHWTRVEFLRDEAMAWLADLAPKANADHTANRPAKAKAFDVRHARALLIAERQAGAFKNRVPTILECRDFLRPHFAGCPNDKLQEAVRSVWPGVQRGPRRRARAEE